MEEVDVVDFASQRIICSWLINQFTEVQRELLSRNQRVRCVDPRGLLIKAIDWDNEIHPKCAGLSALQKWYENQC